MILWDKNYIYATDPNKNVRVKRFPNDWIPGTWVEEFIDYKPFGELKNYVADPPRFMFSSEEYMPETGMYHYLYRAYSPTLARFITRDPIEEAGGVNLYCFVNNNPVSYWDVAGKVSRNNLDKVERLKKIAIARASKCISIFIDKEQLKNQFTSDSLNELIEFVTSFSEGMKFDEEQLSKSILNIVGSNILNIICCFIKDGFNPCQDSYKNRDGVTCQQCCDFEQCKLKLITAGNPPRGSYLKCQEACCIAHLTK